MRLKLPLKIVLKYVFETVFILFLFRFIRLFKNCLTPVLSLAKALEFFIYFKRILKYFKNSFLIAF